MAYKHMQKKESEEVKKAAKKLAMLLNNLSRKYYDENEFGPTADLYADSYTALLDVQDELTWWLD